MVEPFQQVLRPAQVAAVRSVMQVKPLNVRGGEKPERVERPQHI
jgi:hypothetical protein